MTKNLWKLPPWNLWHPLMSMCSWGETRKVSTVWAKKLTIQQMLSLQASWGRSGGSWAKSRTRNSFKPNMQNLSKKTKPSLHTRWLQPILYKQICRKRQRKKIYLLPRNLEIRMECWNLCFWTKKRRPFSLKIIRKWVRIEVQTESPI